MNLTWTQHAQNRIEQWHRRIGLTRDEIEAIVESPGQVVAGDLGAHVFQSLARGGLVRVVVAENAGNYRIVTVYWTSRVARYWQES